MEVRRLLKRRRWHGHHLTKIDPAGHAATAEFKWLGQLDGRCHTVPQLQLLCETFFCYPHWVMRTKIQLPSVENYFAKINLHLSQGQRAWCYWKPPQLPHPLSTPRWAQEQGQTHYEMMGEGRRRFENNRPEENSLFCCDLGLVRSLQNFAKLC